MGYLAVAGLQLELAAGDNRDLLEEEIAGVLRRCPWVRMVVLPELAVFGPGADQAGELADDVEQRFCDVARRHGIWLIPGSLLQKRGDAVFNTAPVISPDGVVIARYRKHYPFLPYERGVSAGQGFVVFDVPGVGRIGLLICYDMWYPEMVRQLAWMGAEAVIVPTLTNTNDRHVELVIAQANAAVNQLYLFNVNCSGRMGYGRSILVGPDGNVVHQASSGREIITAELDFSQVRRVRSRGMHGMAQPLKSFRDAAIHYPVYQPDAGPGALADLGDLALPERE